MVSLSAQNGYSIRGFVLSLAALFFLFSLLSLRFITLNPFYVGRVVNVP